MKIYARNTSVEKIDFSLASFFISKNHRQGMPKRITNPYSYGLYYENELVAVLLVANPRTKAMQKKYCHEISRLAFKKDVTIVGGASKLVKTFIKERNPYNLFTYQSLEGKVTEVYEYCGMTLVSQLPTKKILLHPEVKSYSEAQNNRRDWFSMEQAVRFGPDNLLKTSLGEVVENEKRLSNVELFTEKLGYRIVEVPGDRLYEWHNPNRWHYVYKLTAKNSDKYYYGRKNIDANNPTIKDCLNDRYYGSGGTKFKNWKNKHSDNIIKEILMITQYWDDAVKEETRLIGTLYKTDMNCLNSKPGGVSLGAGNGEVVLEECSKHGLTKFRGSTCAKCSHVSNPPEITMGRCIIHGQVKHVKNSCTKCSAEKSFYYDTCVIHGEQEKHRNGKCVACLNSQFIIFENCVIHNEQPHIDGECFICSRDRGKARGILEVKINRDTNIYECSTCGFQLSFKKRYRILQDTLRGINPCPNCQWWNSTKVLVEAHNFAKNIYLPNKKKSYVFSCPTCETEFKSTLRLLLKKIEQHINPCPNNNNH